VIGTVRTDAEVSHFRARDCGPRGLAGIWSGGGHPGAGTGRRGSHSWGRTVGERGSGRRCHPERRGTGGVLKPGRPARFAVLSNAVRQIYWRSLRSLPSTNSWSRVRRPTGSWCRCR